MLQYDNILCHFAQLFFFSQRGDVGTAIRSNHVEFVVSPGRGLRAGGADAMHFQPMTAHTKAVIGGHAFQHGGNFVVPELNQLAAFLQMK